MKAKYGTKLILEKFGLQANKKAIHNALETQIIKEQATSLGRAGRKLRKSLESYEREQNNASDRELASLIKLISENVWELILQREFVGFVEGNLDWIRSNYVIPEQALKILGARTKEPRSDGEFAP